MADVIPVAGLLAHAASSATLEDHDAANLRTLAGYDQGDLLIDVDEYLELSCDVGRKNASDYSTCLASPGCRLPSIQYDQPRAASSDINGALLEKSGLPRLLHVIDGTFANCADQIKAGQTLAAVTRLSYQAERCKWPARPRDDRDTAR